jgi:serine/threonine protein kinase
MIKRTETLLKPGVQVGPYRVDRFKTKTRLSEIAEATHVETGYSVALKIPTGPEGQELLENEMTIYHCLRGIKNLYLVTMHGSGLWGDTPYIATEWQSNGTLQERIPTPPSAAELTDTIAQPPSPRVLQRNLKIVADAAAGLAALHEHATVHRDIKPANVAVDDVNTGKLLDFGVAASMNSALYSEPRTIDGTLGQSIPPEVFLDGAIVAPSRDIWAMATTAFRSLTGVMVFGEPNPADPIEHYRQIVKGPQQTLRDFHPNASSDLDSIITEGLNPDPTKRPSAAEMRDVFNSSTIS